MKNKKIISFVAALMIACYPIGSTIMTLDVYAKPKYNYEYKYILLAENGNLCVYKTTDLINPIRIIKFDINYLPNKDQEDLKKGIMILNNDELRQRLEDYTG